MTDMNRKDIYEGMVFYNTNGYLSIAYKVTDSNVQIVNYNKSIYCVTKEFCYDLDYKKADISIEQFIEGMNSNLFCNPDKEFSERWERIMNIYLTNLLLKEKENKEKMSVTATVTHKRDKRFVPFVIEMTIEVNSETAFRNLQQECEKGNFSKPTVFSSLGDKMIRSLKCSLNNSQNY